MVNNATEVDAEHALPSKINLINNIPSPQPQPNVPAYNDTANNNKSLVDEHVMSIEDIAQKYNTLLDLHNLNKSVGLTNELVEKRLQEDGLNAISPPKKRPIWLLYLLHFVQLFNIMLIISGILSFILFAIDPSTKVNLVLGVILLLVVTLNSGIELYQEYKTESILEGFLSLVPLQSLVIREGKAQEITSSQLVRGDLVSIRDGQKVPADIRIIQCSRDLKVDNSSITGESEAQERKSQCSNVPNPLQASNLMFSGTVVVSGDGMGIVIRTGDKSILGQIAKLTIQGKPRPSQLSNEINLFVRKIALVAVLTAIIFFVYGLLKGLGIGITFSFAIGIFTAFVPQGLPATVTMLLALSAKRLSKKNVLVKDLHGVETLGSITLLASDKTGTLTQNKMTVVVAWLDEKKWYLTSTPDMDYGILEKQIVGFPDLVLSCLICSRARIIKLGEYMGDATEIGLLKFGLECKKNEYDGYGSDEGEYLDNLKNQYPKISEIPFNSTNKWHLTIHKISKEEAILLLKGAPERVFSKCSTFKNNILIDERFTKLFNEANAGMAEAGKRVLAFAKKIVKIDKIEEYNEPENIKELEFIGLLGLMDPPKKGVKRAIAACQTAGIQVVMVTGDQPLTAESIARQIGIIHGCTKEYAAIKLGKNVNQVTEDEYEAIIIHGDQLSNLIPLSFVDEFNDEDWDQVLSKKEIVFARTLPKQKLEIVTRFQAKGHIVGASGDGVNDAPALKKADLGISMNHTASDVSKEAANMILLDDDFVSIVAGISEGRLIFSNLKKSIRYTLTHIMPEVMALLVFIIFMVPLPLGSLLILIFDLSIELMPAISFSFEKAERDLMLVPPRKVLVTRKSKTNGTKLDGKDDDSIVDNDCDKEVRIPVEQPVISPAQLTNESKIKLYYKKIKSLFTQKSTGEVLVDDDMLIWCYLEGGLIESMGCFAGYLIALVWLKVPLNASAETYFKPTSPPLKLTNNHFATGKEQVKLAAQAQGAFFLCLIIIQWFNLFLTKQRFTIEVRKWLKNYYTFLGLLIGGVIGFGVVYIPGLNNVVFQVGPAPPIALLMALGGGMFLFVYEWTRRYLRRKGKAKILMK